MRPRTRVAVIVVCLTITGCGVPGQPHPTRLKDNNVNVVIPATTTSLPNGTRTRHVELCLISGDHLVAYVVVLPTPLSVARTLEALVNPPAASLVGPARTAISDANLVTAKATTGGVANVDLSAEFAQIPATDQIFVVAQVVCTLTSLPGIGQVHFTRDGQPVDVARADGSRTNEPVARSDYKAILPGSSAP